MRVIFTCAVCSAFALLPALSAASPIVVYNNFGAGQSYDTSGAADDNIRE
jgi:hypothetical protein